MEFTSEQIIYIGGGLLSAMAMAMTILYKQNIALTEKLIIIHNQNIEKLNELTASVNKFNDKWFSILEQLLDKKLEG